MSVKCDVIFIFTIYSQLWAIRNLDSRHIVCKTYIFINSNFLSYKKWKKNWHSFHTIALSKRTILVKKRQFLAKDADICKIKKVLVLKGVLYETTYVSVLMC